MRKLLIAIGAFLLTAGIAQATLYDFYGGDLPSVAERSVIAEKAGIFGYTGTYDQNIALEGYLRSEGSFGLLGATQRPSGYKTTLAESLTATASSTESIKVSSLKTREGHTLVDADVGAFIILTIAPGRGNEEKLACTGGTDGTNNWETCTRGYSYYSQAATATVYAHSPGESVIISDDDAYNAMVYGYLSSNNTWTGTNTSTGQWIFSNTNGMCLTNTNFCLRQSGGNLQWTLNGFTDSYNFTSSTVTTLTASSTRAIGVTDSKIHVNASSTLGMTFGADGYLYQKASSTKGLLEDSNGIYLDETQARNWSGEQVITSTSTITKIKAGGSFSNATGTLNVLGETYLTGNTTSTGSLYLGGDLTFNQLNSTTTAMDALTAYSPGAANTTDTTIYLGWHPRYIRIDYYVQGKEAGVTLHENGYFNVNENNIGRGSQILCSWTSSDGDCTGSGIVFGLETSGMEGGDINASGEYRTTVSVNSISTTGFVIRQKCEVNEASACAANVLWTAYR